MNVGNQNFWLSRHFVKGGTVQTTLSFCSTMQNIPFFWHFLPFWLDKSEKLTSRSIFVSVYHICIVLQIFICASGFGFKAQMGVAETARCLFVFKINNLYYKAPRNPEVVTLALTAWRLNSSSDCSSTSSTSLQFISGLMFKCEQDYFSFHLPAVYSNSFSWLCFLKSIKNWPGIS